MKQKIIHGTTIDFVTPDEIVNLIPRPEEVSRVRAPANIALDATGSGVVQVYKVPTGMEFSLRRVSINLSTASAPGVGEVALTAAIYVAYQRGDEFIEYGQPQYGSAVQVPGVQTWGEQQGPTLRNGEVFQVKAVGLTANANLLVSIEGILRRPSVVSTSAQPRARSL